MNITLKIRKLLYIPFLLAGAALAVSSCSDEDEVLQGGNGYVQFKVYKSASYEAQTASRAGNNELDSLYEAQKIKVMLNGSDFSFSQTLPLNSYDSENAEYGLRSDKLELTPGEYTVTGFYLYGKTENQIYAGQPAQPTTFTVTSGGLVVQDLVADAVARGTVKFRLVKNIMQSRSTDADPYPFSSIDEVNLRVQNMATKRYKDFNGLEVEYTEDFTGKGDGSRTGVGVIDSLLTIEAGTYQIVSYTAKDNGKILTYFDDEVLQETTFTVEDNKLTETDVPVNLVETAANIKDYIALKEIWDAMDGPNWSYVGETYPKGVNWDFNKDIDMWGEQPGVTMDANGRINSLSLSNFGAKGVVPDAIGELSELVTLELGTHNDLLRADLGTDPLASVKGKPTPEQLEAIRLDYMKKYRDYNIRDGFSDALKLGFEKKGTYNRAARAARVTPKDVTWGNLTSGITGISPAIGKLKKLEILYVANAPITELPKADATNPDEYPGMAGLTACTDLEIYNCPNMTEFPDVIAEMPSLIQVNLAMNRQWEEGNKTGLSDGLKAMAEAEGKKEDGPTIQILYLGYNNLKTLPEEIKNMKKLGRLDCIYNKLTELPALGKDVNLVQALFDHNQIEEIKTVDGIFCGMEDVETFSCSYNKLTTLPDIFDVNSIYTMASVDFSFNEIETLTTTGKHGGINVSTLSLAGNKLTEFPYDLFEAGSPITELNLSANKISKFEDGDWTEGKYTYYLTSLDLSYNRLKELPEKFDGHTFPYLYGLSLDGNQLDGFPWGAANVSYLGVLSLRNQRDDAGNRVYSEWPTNIGQHVGLYALFLGGNDIQMVPETETLSPNIYILDVSDNPYLILNVSSVCAYIQAGMYTLIYDPTQDIRGCDALDLE